MLKAPESKDLVGATPQTLAPLPWYDPAKVAWVEIPDVKNKVISRYAYWVEDLQGKVNAQIAGNADGTAGLHKRQAYPSPASKPLAKNEPPLNVIAMHVMDPKSGDLPVGDITQKVINGRPAMISPDSILGATAFASPLKRTPQTGLLEDPLAASLERSVSPAIRSYREQPVVPYALGIASDAAGKPKLNLNKLLSSSRTSAINDFADWVNKGLPKFDERKGGFPDNYVNTLAANAFDYVDIDNNPTIQAGSHRGIDVFPMLSEIALKVEYLGYTVSGRRLLLNWRLKLFGEFWNMTNKAVSGNASLSYEVALNHTPIGSGTTGIPFDSMALLQDTTKSKHDLKLRNGRFFGPDVRVELQPDEYRYYQFADVQCSIDVGPNNVDYKTKFLLEEKASDARGVSVLWDGVETERTNKIVRDLGDPDSRYMEFTILYPKTVGKAGIPGAGYGPYGDFTNNMGDPRMSTYFRIKRLSENSLQNLSPNRRNIRRKTIYDSDGSTKPRHYGRVLPSEWPDGGQNSPIGTFPVPSDSSFAVEPTSSTYGKPASSLANAPTRISNEGRFYSAVELGNIYDPVMWLPTYADRKGASGSGAKDTNTLLGLPIGATAMMPTSRYAWPDATFGSAASADYGGGNTLRLGRPEHEKFDVPGKHAAHLLDLFYAGDADAPAGLGADAVTVNINGNININTAEKDAIRAMAAGMLKQDTELRKVTDWAHDVTSGRYSPKSVSLEAGSPTREKAADRLAEGIIRSRPFASMKELAAAKDADDQPVFGNKMLYPDAEKLQWTDAAAEEIFARVHDASTLRSRNFRVWAIGQSISKNGSTVEVLAETRKVFTVFIDPGERKTDGAIDPLKVKPRITYEKDF